MIRELQERDIEWLKAHSNGYEWQFGPDFAGGLVYVDAQDRLVVAVGGWARVEVHAVQDASWGCPGMREAAFQELHDSMAARMKAKGFGEATTYFDRVEAKCKRLVRIGWTKINRTAYGKAL